MKPSLQLFIPKPCHENWDAMHPTKQGKFCGSCAKQVIDFSLMTDTEVLNYLNNAKGKTCGRFSADQLERTLYPTKIQAKKTWKWVVATALSLCVNFKKSVAQKVGTVKTDKVNVAMKEQKIILGDTIIMPDSMLDEVKKKKKIATEIIKDYSIYGKIVDEKNNPIPYASILIKNTNKGTTTNAIGEFTLNIGSYNKSVGISVIALGYEQVERTIFLKSAKDDSLIQLKQKVNELPEIKIASGKTISCTRLLGEVTIVDSKPNKKDTSLASVRKVLDNSLFAVVENPLKVYPNPVSKNTSLNIEIGIIGNVQIQLLDINGKLIAYEEVHNISKKRIVQLPLQVNITTGIYFVKIVDSEKQKQYVEKIIVR